MNPCLTTQPHPKRFPEIFVVVVIVVVVVPGKSRGLCPMSVCLSTDQQHLPVCTNLSESEKLVCNSFVIGLDPKDDFDFKIQTVHTKQALHRPN